MCSKKQTGGGGITINCSVKTVLGKQSINKANSIPRKLQGKQDFRERCTCGSALSDASEWFLFHTQSSSNCTALGL